MKKTLLAALLATAFAAPVMAQTAAAAPEAAPAPALTGNLGLFSSYRFRGIDQTYGKPALQGGFDYAHSSGLYVGNWNSNVQSGAGYPGGNLEMDFYGGYKHAFGDFGLDVGAIYYYYPGTNATGAAPITNSKTTKTHTGSIDNKEIYIGGSWKFISAKYFYSLGDYFSAPETSGTQYLDLSANYDLGDGWGINGHVGTLKMRNYSNGRTNGDYTDWKLGITKDISGWVLAASYIDTNAKGNCSKDAAGLTENYCFSNSNATSTKDAGKATAVVSISKSF